jgi:hypothetical protein
MFCAPRLVFDGTEDVGSRFHVLRARTHFRHRGRQVSFSCFSPRTRFRRCRGRQVPFSCFALPDTFSVVPGASGPVFMFCAPGLIFGGTRGIGSCFHVLRARTHFRRYRGRRVSCSCIRIPDSFSAIPRASGLVFTFCAPGLIFGGIGGVGSCFLVLRAQTHFRWFQGLRVPYSCSAHPNSFSMVPRSSGPIFIFSARTHFRPYRGRRVPFPCYALPNLFSTLLRASGPIFLFCTPGLIFGGAGGVGSLFHILRSRTRFRRYLGRRVPLSCFGRPNSFSVVPRASDPVFMICALEHVFVGTEGVRCRSALPDSFSAVQGASSPIF